jgi:transposase
MDRHGPIHLGEGQAVALIGDGLGGVRWRTSDKAAHRGSATKHWAQRLLDEGWSCQQVAHALLLDDDTIRGWRRLFEQRGIEGVTSFDVGGSASYLTATQEDDLKAWVGAALPRSTRQIGAWIETEFSL